MRITALFFAAMFSFCGLTAADACNCGFSGGSFCGQRVNTTNSLGSELGTYLVGNCLEDVLYKCDQSGNPALPVAKCNGEVGCGEAQTPGQDACNAN